MPIIRTYICPRCNFTLEVTLAGEDWDAPAPVCPQCRRNRGMSQEFKPPAIVTHAGQARDRADKITDDIVSNDFHVADYTRDRHEGSTPKHRYKDHTPAQRAVWGAAQETLQAAVAAGLQSRLRFGSGLDVLQQNLKDGSQPDLIEASKRRSARIW